MIRTTSIFTAGLATGILLSTFACWRYQDYLEVKRRSSVDHPLTMIFNDIASDVERGNAGLAARKSLALRDFWTKYLDGHRSPEQFSNDVMALRAAD
jgi:hypothetical protein